MMIVIDFNIRRERAQGSNLWPLVWLTDHQTTRPSPPDLNYEVYHLNFEFLRKKFLGFCGDEKKIFELKNF